MHWTSIVTAAGACRIGNDVFQGYICVAAQAPLQDPEEQALKHDARVSTCVAVSGWQRRRVEMECENCAGNLSSLRWLFVGAKK
jgi:hypothetical protein